MKVLEQNIFNTHALHFIEAADEAIFYMPQEVLYEIAGDSSSIKNLKSVLVADDSIICLQVL